jgi:hypothetical protein
MNAEHFGLEARFAAPAERDLPPGRHDLYREILMNHMLTQPSGGKPTRRGGSRSWRPPARVLAAVTAVAAIAAGVASYVIAGARAPAARPPVANHPATSRVHPGQAAHQAVLAAKVLRAVAARVTREGVAREPSPGQWIYSKTVGYGYPGIVGPSGVTTDEEWVTFDGIQSAYYADGQLVTHTSPLPPPSSAVNPWKAWNAGAITPKNAYDVLASLPPSPQALLAVIAREASQNPQNPAGNPVSGVTPKTEAQREFDYLTSILWNAAGGVGGPPAAEAAAYQAMASLPGITVQQGIKDTAGGTAIGVSDDGGYDQLLIDPVSSQVIGIRQLSTGIKPMSSIDKAIASGHVTPSLRKLLAKLSRAKRESLIARAKNQHEPAYPPKGTLIDETVRVRTAEVAAPGDR